MKHIEAGERKEFVTRLLARQQTIVDTLCSGSAESIEEYRDWTGYLRCIRDVFIILEEVRKDVKQDREGVNTNADSTDEDTGSY